MSRKSLQKLLSNKPLWRNWLARSAVNRKAVGSIPTRGVSFFLQIILELVTNIQNIPPSSGETFLLFYLLITDKVIHLLIPLRH